MARKSDGSGRSSPSIKPLKAAPKGTSPVRNTSIPRSQPRVKEISHEMIAYRAYEIYLSGSGGSECDNWLRAERELRGA
jgi:hypothetical protein